MADLLLFLVACVPVFFYLTENKREWSFLDPVNTFWIVFIYFGVIQPLAGEDDWIHIYGRATYTETLAMFLLSGLAVALGYRNGLGRALGRSVPTIGNADQLVRYRTIGIWLCATGLAGYLILIRDAGGWAQYIRVSRTATNETQDLSNYVVSLRDLVPLGLFLLLCHVLSDRKAQRARLVVYLAFAAFTLWTVYSGTRWGVIEMAMIFLGSYYGMKRTRPNAIVMLVSLALVVVTVGFVTEYRDLFYDGQFHITDTPSEVIRNSLKSFTSDTDPRGPTGVELGSEFGMSMAVAHYVPDYLGYDNGYMLLELFTRAIPRSLWPGKTYPEGEAWDRVYRISGTSDAINSAGLLTGPAPGFVAKWYYMFGYAGLIFGGIFTGVFLRFLKVYVSKYSGIGEVVLAVAACPLGFSEMNNPLLWPISWLPSTGVAVFLVLLIGRAKIRSRWPQIRASARSNWSSLPQ